MGKIKAIIQNKGGVGKSTIVSHLAAAMSKKYPNKRVLIVDTDPQGNQAISFGLRPSKIENTLYDVLVKNVPAEDVIFSLSDNLDLLPSNGDMNFYEIDTMPRIEKIYFRKYLLSLKTALAPVVDSYDLVLIDSPPELKVVALQILMTANDVYIPFEPDVYNAQGLIELLKRIQQSKKEYKMFPQVRGLILNKVEERTRLHRGISIQVDAFCLKNNIPILNVKIPKSTVYPHTIGAAGKPITWVDPNHRYSQYYYDLLEEVIKHG
jgi:chromosome partitioning protein